jgi:hypothetical protein
VVVTLPVEESLEDESSLVGKSSPVEVKTSELQ